MARPSAGDTPPNQPLSPFHTPPAGMPAPIPGTPFSYVGQLLPPAPPAKTGPTPLGVLNALKRRWVMAGLIGLLASGVAAVGVWLALPSGKHEAKAHVRMRLPANDGLVRNTEDPESYRKTQVFLLKTRTLINRTLAEPSVASLETIRNSDDPIKLLEENIKVTLDGPEVITVTMTGDNPEDMKVILDQLIKRYIDDATLIERKEREDKINQLERMAITFKGEIDGREATLKLMAESHNTAGIEDAAAQNARLQIQLATLDAEVFAADKHIMDLDAQMALLKSKIDAKQFDFSPAELEKLVESDPMLIDLRRERFEKDALLDLDRKVSVPGSPNAATFAAREAEIKKLDEAIKVRREKVQAESVAMLKSQDAQKLIDRSKQLVVEKETAVKIREARNSMRNSLEGRVRQGVSGGLNVQALRKELDPLKEQKSRVENELLTLRIAKEMPVRVSPHGAPYVVVNKNLKQKVVLASAVSVVTLFGVLALVGFLEWRTRRVDGVDQVVTDLGMRVIGTVPAFPNRANLKAAEVAGGANWRFALNESINSTRTMLLHTARSQSMQVVMVTSATQGEGKTSLASQLATSMATAGMRTLIVDCDLRNPSIHKLFDLGLSAGVSEVLCQEADVSDAVQPTAVPNLWVIPAGQCSHRVINALAQGHPLETLFNRLRGQFDFIIVDSCPVLPVADALLIGQHVDGVLFSIMQDISQLPKVMTASEKLAQLNIPLVGAVVNGIRQNTYSYGYNYVKQLPA
ncbi:MAG: polysaccharide biosynthesis tyrosine autokinase [Gemmataceae bacterium]|nr:polysaccharide biosynthesis tyrosine autokinase [Gemmataceae bacterium]